MTAKTRQEAVAFWLAVDEKYGHETVEQFEKKLYARPDKPGIDINRAAPMQHGESFMRPMYHEDFDPPTVAPVAHYEEPVYQRGDRSKVVLPPPVEYAKPTMIRRRKVGNEAKFLYGFHPATATAPVQWEYQPPQLWMPDDLIENEVSSSSGDPLVILLEREGAYQEANELRQQHRAATTQGVLKFYMEQRPDRYPCTLPGTVWVNQANGSTAEVQPYVRTRRKVA